MGCRMDGREVNWTPRRGFHTEPAGSAFGVRLYDPWAGVWLTREPLPGQPAEPRTGHRYAYAFANPINSRDPYGFAVTPGDGGGEGPLPPHPVPPKTFASTPVPTPTGASRCVQPLPDELWRYARQAAAEFKLPPEFVAAVLWAQQRYDYTGYQDAVEDVLAETALLLIETQQFNQRRGWPSADAGGQGWLVLAAIERLDLSLGVGQVRLSTARKVAEAFYGTSPSTRELIGQLEDPEWNVRYMAGYLRLLANERGTETFTIAEMQILYGAY